MTYVIAIRLAIPPVPPPSLHVPPLKESKVFPVTSIRTRRKSTHCCFYCVCSPSFRQVSMTTERSVDLVATRISKLGCMTRSLAPRRSTKNGRRYTQGFTFISQPSFGNPVV
ncbi:hypothetical protein WG66_014043 [Moniliophthora roreri]|nr:hypothetical protein WG66_014043 [Moniliophthora roreri]